MEVKDTDEVVAPSPADLLMARVESRQRAVEDFHAHTAELEEIRKAEQEGPGFWKETGRAVWGAAVDLTSEGGLFLADAFYELPPVRNFHSMVVGIREDLAPEAAGAEASRRWEEFQGDFRASAEELAPANESLAGGAARGIMTFLVPYSRLAKTGQLQSFSAATSAGFVIDYTLFDPNEGNLSNLIEELNPEAKDSALTFLATDPDDDDAINRLKNGLEGVFLGGLVEAVLKTARHIKGRKAVEKAHEAADAMTTEVVFDTPVPAAGVVDDAATARPVDESTATAKTDDAKVEAEAEQAAPVTLRESLRDSLTLTPAQARRFNDLIDAGDEAGATKALEEDFNLDTINWDNIDNASALKTLLDTTSEVLADHIKLTKGGVQSHVQTKRLANLVGTSGEQVHELFKDVRGDVGIAARMHAAQRVMLASVRELDRLRQVAKANPGDLQARASFMQQVQLHGALQAQVKGAQTEIARALNAMKLMKNEASEGFKEFDDLSRALGTKNPKDFNKYMDDLLDGKSLEDINEAVRQASRGERLKNIFVEYIINAMLSSPKTHIVNAVSNTLNTFIYTGDRLLAGTGRALRGDPRGLREAKIDLMRKVSSLGEAFKLARQAWKDGAPVSDKRQRIEFQTRQAISMDGEGALAATVNALGHIIRTPGRMLITGDEFFKAINRNAELSVQAYRKADELARKQGLEAGTRKYERFVDRTMHRLLDPANQAPMARDIRRGAVEKSRLVSFQETPKTDFGAAMEKMINTNTFVKLLIAPFFRTPMNILRQGIIDRTPLGLIVKEHRELVMNGSPAERAEALTRMTTGVAAMAGFMAFTGTELDSPIQVVGKVPYESSEKATGVLDYSIRIGAEWYQFNRLDPLGMWLGMVADAKMHAEHSTDEEQTFALMQGALAGFFNNVTNKTWAKSMSDLFELFEGFSSNKPAAVDRALAKFSAGEFGKLIPQLFKSTGRALADGEESFAREAWTFTDALNAQLPVLNRDVPRRHDAIGRLVSWENAKWAIVNPFAVSPAAESPLDKELARLDFDIRPMRKALAGGQLQLTAAEYSEMTGLVGKVRLGNHRNLEDFLGALVETPRYREANDAMRVFMMKKVINQARRAAAMQFIAKPENLERFREIKHDQFAKLIGDVST
ncbi:hypothetical protein [Microbulbifer discodermiae]|uniref:hypothetical protein n=1 Tax=Microbulbifer sp. 2201CG32-9 TaxID=3232309 RepID=UPI00345C4364